MPLRAFSKTIGGAGVAFILGLAGYVANQPQTATALQAIHGVLTLLPIAIMVVLIVLTKLYRLDSERHAEIVAQLSDSGERVRISA